MMSPLATPSSKKPAPWWSWWPLLLGPATIACFYLVMPQHYTSEAWKPDLEMMAKFLVPIAVLAGIVRFASQRMEYHLVLTLLATTVLFREIRTELHWDWIDTGVYVAIGILAAWGWLRRRRMNIVLDPNPSARTWLIATGCTYVLSQVVARRALRGVLPQEDLVYTDMEELLENLAHTMLIVTILIGSWKRVPGTRNGDAAA